MLRNLHATGAARSFLTGRTTLTSRRNDLVAGRKLSDAVRCIINAPTMGSTMDTNPLSLNDQPFRRQFSVMNPSSKSSFGASETVSSLAKSTNALMSNKAAFGPRGTTNTIRRNFSAAKFTMDQLKDLRARSGAPIVDCKKALNDSEGDLDKAMDWLRQHGAAKASSKVSGRDATEGLVACKVDPSGKTASLVLVSSETDFAGRSPAFVDLITHVADAALLAGNDSSGSLHDNQDALMALEADSKSIKTALEEAIVAIRENLGIKSAIRFHVDDDSNSILVGYVHGRVDGSNAGSAAAIVEIAGSADASTELMQEVGKKLAMHVVAAKPEYLDPEGVPAEAIEKERSILESQVNSAMSYGLRNSRV